MTDQEVKKLSARHTRRSFLVAAAGAAAGYELYHRLKLAPQDELLQEPFRRALNFNEALARGLFRERALSPTYPIGKSKELRVNGNYGLKKELVPETYRLQVVGVEAAKNHPKYVADVTAWQYQYVEQKTAYAGHDTKVDPKAAAMPPAFAKAFADYNAAHKNKPVRGNEEAGESASTLDPNTPGLLLTFDDITRLPHHELVTQFKCIEGWSEIVHWGGVRLRDFIAAYPPATNAQGKLPKYVYMETPDGDYYTGYHLHECMHPQSLLVTQMAGRPLGQWHGAPLRLHMPIKYGYKQIKRIALIAYTDDKPDDYWTKLGYDWYAGL
jgi:Oxidoreductase molybdopterin binding domain